MYYFIVHLRVSKKFTLIFLVGGRSALSKVVDEVKILVEKYAQECGVEIVDVEYVKKNNGNNLTIFIDKDGKVDIEDCVRLHKKIDKPLDELDPTKGESYILNVSSCGIDRPFKCLRDYERAIGKIIEVKFYKPFQDKKVIVGELIDANEKEIKVKVEEKIIEIETIIIASANRLFQENEEN